MYRPIFLTALLGVAVLCAEARSEQTLRDGWRFTKGGADTPEAAWQTVRVPHDWAIYGPFDRANDLQTVAVEQNGETEETVKTGRTGGLPFIGKGAYRRSFHVDDPSKDVTTLVFDGAMSNARVSVNGHEVAFWPYGYNSFYTTLPDSVLRAGDNDLLVELENYERASRWYPGAGLYRNVHQITTGRVHIPVWGTYVTTPTVKDGEASVRLRTRIAGTEKGEKIGVHTVIYDPDGREVADDSSVYTAHGQEFSQNFLIPEASLWSPESPALYTAVTSLYDAQGNELDKYSTRFGVRTLDYIPDRGFFLNGRPVKFKGVCNHHDL